MKSIIYVCVFLSILSLQSTSANSLIQTEIYGYNLKIIEYDTASEDFDLKIWISDQWTSLRNIMDSVGWITGVTGVFTCPKDYSACWGRTSTINERYVDGKKLSTYPSTWERVVLWWNEAYEAFIFQTDAINGDREVEIYEWLANHPLLILDGIPMTQSYWEKWLIDQKMRDRGTRNFICANKDSSKFYFWLVYLIDIDNLAAVLKKLWCHNAINLDAGFSTAMIYNNNYIAGPGREILDWVFIVPKDIDLQKFALQAEKIASKIHNKLKKYRQEKRIQALTPLSPKIEDFLESVNEQFTSDILEQNFVWEMDIVWKKTALSVQAIERVYLLESLQREITSLVDIYKKEIKQRDATASFDLKF